SCETGPIQCCNTVTKASDPAASSYLGSFWVSSLRTSTVLVGLTCSPVSIIGLPGNSCSGQTVCCSNNNFSGLISIGCTPININV
ncbi:hydrophobin, partial [Coprinopsis sp. MPI-PUGE-AT-0042]